MRFVYQKTTLNYAYKLLRGARQQSAPLFFTTKYIKIQNFPQESISAHTQLLPELIY